MSMSTTRAPPWRPASRRAARTGSVSRTSGGAPRQGARQMQRRVAVVAVVPGARARRAVRGGRRHPGLRTPRRAARQRRTGRRRSGRRTPARWCCCRTTTTCGTPPRPPPNRPAPKAYGSPLIPTRSAVQGIAALAVHEPGRSFDEDVVAMTSAAGATRYAELAVAERQSWTMAGVCQAGDVLGLIDGRRRGDRRRAHRTADDRARPDARPRAGRWSPWSSARRCPTGSPGNWRRYVREQPSRRGHGRLRRRPACRAAAHRRGVSAQGPCERAGPVSGPRLSQAWCAIDAWQRSTNL